MSEAAGMEAVWERLKDAVRQRPLVHVLVLFLYYGLITAGLILLYGRGDFSTPPFIYQGF